MPSDNGSLTLRVRSYGDLWGQETMLLAVELVAALFFGFVLGRIWEIRRRIILVEHVDERPLRVENSGAVQLPERPPRGENELVAAFDREMKKLVSVLAAKGRRLPQIANRRA